MVGNSENFRDDANLGIHTTKTIPIWWCQTFFSVIYLLILCNSLAQTKISAENKYISTLKVWNFGALTLDVWLKLKSYI